MYVGMIMKKQKTSKEQKITKYELIVLPSNQNDYCCNNGS